MSEQDYVIIPSKVVREKIVVPQFQIQRNISNQGITALASYKTAPNLAQILHACELSGQGIGIDQYIPNGEWTADFVDYDVPTPEGIIVPKGYISVVLIRRPESLEQRANRWYVEGGERINVLLPSDGWVVSGFDVYTGIPFDTSTDYRKGESTNYSYFWRLEKGAGLIPINRECNWRANGPFQVGATLDLNFSYDDVGAREIK